MGDAFTPEILSQFPPWILDDVGMRCDATGTRSDREHRCRTAYIQTRGVLTRDTWGLCWQGNERGRGTDFSWRLTLAVEALQEAGHKNWQACCIVADYPAVRHHLLRYGRRKDGKNRDDEYDTINSIRATVNNYQRHWHGVDIKRELQMWLGMFRSIQRDGLWYKDAITEYRNRIRLCRKALGAKHHLVLQTLLCLAAVYHEHEDYRETIQLYKKASRILRHQNGVNQVLRKWVTLMLSGVKRKAEPKALPVLVVKDGELLIYNTIDTANS